MKEKPFFLKKYSWLFLQLISIFFMDSTSLMATAAVTVFSNDTPESGTLDMIIDGDFDATQNCLTMSGATPSVTIDYDTS